MNFRLRAITPKEKTVQDGVIDYLYREQALGRVAWFKRNNGGAQQIGKRWIWFYRIFLPNEKPKSKDYPDIDGLLSDGRMLLIECKRPGGYVRKGQREIIELAALHGAAAGIVDCIDDAVRIVRGE